MKRIWGYIAILIVMFTLTEVKAFSVEKETLYIKPGSKEQIHLYANVKEETANVTFLLTYSTNDLKGTNFTASNNAKDKYDGNSTHAITLSEPTSGKIDLGTIDIVTIANPKEGGGTITVQEVTKNNANVLNLKKLVITVKIGDEVEEETTPNEETHDTDVQLLTKIESNIVNINIVKDVFEYTVTVPSTVEKLDLKPITSGEDVVATISSQKINELSNGAITIKLDNGEITQQYKINVNVTQVESKTTLDEETQTKKYHYKWKYLVVIALCGLLIAATYYVKLPKGE